MCHKPKHTYYKSSLFIKTKEEGREVLARFISNQVLRLIEYCISSVTCSCLSNSLTALGDKVGTTSRWARTLAFSSTSFFPVVNSSDLASTLSFSQHFSSRVRQSTFSKLAFFQTTLPYLSSKASRSIQTMARWDCINSACSASRVFSCPTSFE